MGDTLQKVRAGEPLSIPATAYNAFIDAAQYVRHQQNIGGAGGGGMPAAGTVLVRNGAATAMDCHSVLAITGVELDPSDDAAIVYRDPILSCAVPATGQEGKFVVLAEPIDTGEIGRAYVDGVCWVKVVTTDADGDNYRSAEISNGVSLGLVAGPSGSAKILWRDSGIGANWAVVRIGASAGGGVPITVKLYNADGATGGSDGGTPASYSTCAFVYDVRALDGTTVIATAQSPAQARIANVKYVAAADGTFGLWEASTATLLVAFGERPDSTTECET